MKLGSIFSVAGVIFAQFASVAAVDDLVIDVTHAVECKTKTQKGDRISVHYEGRLEDGTVFDSSFKRGTPITFQIGVGQVITGWDQGLANMCIGEKRELTIPPHLAYGERGIGPIPPQATLIFSTELVDIAGHDEL